MQSYTRGFSQIWLQVMEENINYLRMLLSIQRPAGTYCLAWRFWGKNPLKINFYDFGAFYSQ
jgi:hypothetical protein